MPIDYVALDICTKPIYGLVSFYAQLSLMHTRIHSNKSYGSMQHTAKVHFSITYLHYLATNKLQKRETKMLASGYIDFTVHTQLAVSC